jgi:integrase
MSPVRTVDLQDIKDKTFTNNNATTPKTHTLERERHHPYRAVTFAQTDPNVTQKSAGAFAATADYIDIRGGGYAGCLAASDIDKMLTPVIPADALLPAVALYRVRVGLDPADEMHKRIRGALSQPGAKLYAPLHVRFHWTAAVLSMSDGKLVAEVFDSAPSKYTARDILKLLKMVGASTVSITCTGRQPRMSDECGIHAIVNLWAMFLKGSVHQSASVRDLAHLRAVFTKAAKKPGSVPHTARQVTQQTEQQRTDPRGGANEDAAEAQPQAAEPTGCTGRTKAGRACKAALVEGHAMCPAHLYAERDASTCGRTSNESGGKCPHKCAKGMTACPMHVIKAAEHMGRGPPIPGKGLASGPLLGAQVAATAPLPPVQPPPPQPQATAPFTIDAELARPEPSQDFWNGHQRMPSVADIPGHALKQLTMVSNNGIPFAARHGISKEQRAAHRRVWRRLLAMPAEIGKLSLPFAVLETLRMWRSQANWCPTTWQKTLATTLGALARAMTYTTCPRDLPISGISVIKDAMAAAQKEASAFEASAPKAASKEQIYAAMEQAPLAVKEKLAVAWLTAGRIGDVTQLKMEHISLTNEGMTVQFRRGKTAGTAPYTVPTRCPPEWRPMIEGLLTRRKRGEFLWPAGSAQARAELGRQVALTLKQVDRALEQRSVRRGALQHMADSGVPDETLLLFSGHKRLETLKRYLDWGRKGGERLKRGVEAAKHLTGGRN